jgi:hypothetical protein
MKIVLVPILEGKVEVWKAWSDELMGPRKEEFQEFNRRYGLSRHAAWLAETPTGPTVVAFHEGGGEDNFMELLAKSDHTFDQWFKSKVLEIHNLDLASPPEGPPPELRLDSSRL